jgi:transcriptional regulator with XRE-family HTH domain
MKQEKIGKFISSLRKDKGMTQQELADKLGVTDRAIGNWENGRRLPDYSIIQNLCRELDISTNEFFAGNRIKANEKEKQFDKNILNIFKFNNDKRKKYKFIVLVLSILLIISCIFIGRIVLIKRGYLPDPNLAYAQRYEKGKDNLKGNVNYDKYESISMDFEIGANKYGYAVFKNPAKALRRLKKNYSKGLKAIQREFKLLPLSMFNFRMYGIYGWQLSDATDEEKEQGIFISHFFDTYENSFN